MKKILLLLMPFGLASCGALNLRGPCYFKEVPAKYRRDQGKLVIDLETRKPIVNPRYQQYVKCYPDHEVKP